MLKKWQKGMTASNVKLDYASLWIQIWGALFDMVSPQVATKVGNRLELWKTLKGVENRRSQSTL